MTIVRTVFGTLLALVGLSMAMFFLGPILALVYSLIIAVVAVMVNCAEKRTIKPVEGAPPTTERTVAATLWAVMAVWMALDGYGSHDMAGPMFAMILTVVVIVTAMISSVSLQRHQFMTATTVRSHLLKLRPTRRCVSAGRAPRSLRIRTRSPM